MAEKNQSDLRLRQMQAGVDALSEGFALFDDADALVFCNAAYRRLYPDLDSFLTPGTAWPLIVAEAGRRRGSAEFDQINAHLTSGLDSPLILDACKRGLHWHRIGIHPAAGGGFVITESDVTDQREAHDIIEHADDLLRDILDACASRIALCRLSDGSILYRTPSWEKAFGTTPGIQQSFVDSVNFTDLLTDLLSSDRVDDREVDLRRADNAPFPGRLSARMIDYQGELAIILSAEDMTQLHAQRDEIIRINQRLLDAIEALDQGFVLFDAEHQLLMANQRYMDVNQPISSAIAPGSRNSDIVKHSLEAKHEVLAAGWPGYESELVTAKYEFSLNDARAFSVSRRETSDGGFVIAWRDITEQRAIERELENQREASYQNEKLNALGQLLAGVAHELNNPLSVVVGHAMMLKDEVTDPEALEGIDKISTAAERCAKIVKTFLAMARQKPAQLVTSNINDIIELALEIASYSLRKSNISINLEFGNNLPSVYVDEDQLIQVFINLMINAEHAMSSLLTANQVQAPQLTISTSLDQETGHVVTLVSDNGPGIPESQRLRIFEPFYTTKSVGEGTGVGLALSHRIVNSHEGVLKLIDSKFGGATFLISLPANQQHEAENTQRAVTDYSTAFKALLVEDEPDVADVIKRLLTKLGVTTTLARNAEEGLQLLAANNTVDLILCDLRMPGMGGYAMLSEIESRWPHLSARFTFITGDAISDEAAEIRSRATHNILEKPISPSDLQLLVRSLQTATATSSTAEDRS